LSENVALRAYPTIERAWTQLREYLRDDFEVQLTCYANCCDRINAEFAEVSSFGIFGV